MVTIVVVAVGCWLCCRLWGLLSPIVAVVMQSMAVNCGGFKAAAQKKFFFNQKLQNINFMENLGSPLQNNTFRMKKGCYCKNAL